MNPTSSSLCSPTPSAIHGARSRLARRLLLVGVLAASLAAGGPAAAPAAGTASTGTVRMLVGYTASGRLSADLVESALGAKLLARLSPIGVDLVSVAAGQAATTLTTLQGSPLVRFVQLDGIVRATRTPNDEFWAGQWASVRTRAPQAWDLTTGSRSVVVAVVDSGVAAAQPDLAGRVLPGYNFVAGNTDTADDDGHGTAVAGVVAATGDNAIGVAGYCWQCSILPVKVLDSQGLGYDSALAQGILWAVDHGARVINTSLGGPVEDLTVAAAAQYAQLHGVLVVAAAGNDGSGTLDYPAALPGVLSVSASDANDQLYPWSNQGSTLSAPGENLTTGSDGGYVSFVGTSSAAPVVSGIAALAFSVAPDATPAAVSQALEATAVPAPGVHYGRVDAYATIHQIAPALTPAPASPPPTTTPAPTTGSGGARSRSKVHSSAAPARRTIAGSIAKGRATASVAVRCGAGRLTATVTLRSSSNARIDVRLTRSDGSVVTSRRGRHRVTVQVRVAQGSYRLVVARTAGTGRLSYRVEVTAPAAARTTQ